MNENRLRIAAPPGVGDTYWAITKLQALRELKGATHVTLCIQKSAYARAADWIQMVDFIDAVEYVKFEPSAALATGYWEGSGAGYHILLWPNAVLDRGGQLADWLPTLHMDLSFPVKTPDMGPPRVVVYASSVGINRVWMERGGDFWVGVIRDLAARFGTVTLVGAEWDKEFRDQLSGVAVEDLVGRTTLPQLAGILRNARVVVGVICGVTILSNHFRTPCIAIWPDHKFPAAFPRSWVAADAPYDPIPVSQLATVSIAERAAAIAR